MTEVELPITQKIDGVSGNLKPQRDLLNSVDKSKIQGLISREYEGFSKTSSANFTTNVVQNTLTFPFHMVFKKICMQH